MDTPFEIDPMPDDPESFAGDLLLRLQSGGELDPVADRPIMRWVILMTPDYRLQEQAESPLQINAERVVLATEAYREGGQPGIRTYLAGWVNE